MTIQDSARTASSTGGDTFSTFLGRQPGAVAVALKTWAEFMGPPRRIALIATQQVAGGLGAIRRYLKSTGIEPEQLVVFRLKRAEPSSSDVRARAEDLLAWNAQFDGRLVFYADPGPKWMVVCFAGLLPAHVLRVHAEDGRLHMRGLQAEFGTSPLCDIGLEALLELHGLKPDAWTGNANVNRWLDAAGASAGVARGLTLRTEFGEDFDMAAAFERHGWLHALCAVSDKSDFRVTEARAGQLAGLNPVLAMLPSPPQGRSRVPLRRRIEQLGHRLVESADDVRDWLAGPVTFEPAPAQNVPATALGAGAEDGPELAVVLGFDPAPTLIAIQSHRPSRVWICCDVHQPAIVAVAHRIAEKASMLACGEVQFVATDWAGLGLTELGARRDPVRPLRVDATSGKAAQGVALSLLPRAEPWSLHTARGRIQHLIDDTQFAPLAGPPLRLWLYAHGGRLTDGGRPVEDVLRWPSQTIDWWLALANELAQMPSDSPKRRRRSLKQVVEQFRVQSPPPFQWRSEQMRGGFWFERLAAAAFARAGADEVLLNAEWEWADQPGMRRDEVDVVARFDHRVYVCSCKLGRLGESDPAIEQRECRAVSESQVARFAIPIMARPTFGGRYRIQMLKQQGLTERINAQVLANPTELAKQCLAFAKRRSTYRQAPSDKGGRRRHR